MTTTQLTIRGLTDKTLTQLRRQAELEQRSLEAHRG